MRRLAEEVDPRYIEVLVESYWNDGKELGELISKFTLTKADGRWNRKSNGERCKP